MRKPLLSAPLRRIAACTSLFPMTAPQSPSTASIFRLDEAQGELWAQGERVAIPPKAIALLIDLVRRSGQIVTRAELVESVWDGLSVSSAAVRHTVRELRRALGDPAEAPVFIETVSRRGWRFVGTPVPLGDGAVLLEPLGKTVPQAVSFSRAAHFVGRESETAQLRDALAHAQLGDRRTIFIAGEAGIGKTALLDRFLDHASRQPDGLVARSECIEHLGAGTPYWPLLELLERVCCELGGALPRAILRRHAPTWLVQLPVLCEPEDRATLEQEIQGATQTRMIRELAYVFDRLSENRVLVLAIEDIQWADPSSLEALMMLARHSASARILLIATVRSEGAPTSDPDLLAKLEALESSGRAERVMPQLLGRSAVRAFLGRRFGADSGTAESAELCDALYEASSGHPLFMVSLVDEWVAQGVVAKQGVARRPLGESLDTGSVPGALLPLLARQVESLEPAQLATLEAASVIGLEFCVLDLEAVLAIGVESLEQRCDALVSDGRFLSARGAVAWPDGRVSSSYRFVHGLHRDVLRHRLSDGRRSRLHRALAERKQAAFAGAEDAIAAELAMHYELGLDGARAALCYAQAGEVSARRFSNREATEHLRKALAWIGDVPAAERDLQEVRIRLALCAPLAAVAGYAAEELEINLVRLEALTRNLEDSIEMFPIILGLWSLNLVRCDLVRNQSFADRLLALAERDDSPLVRLQAHRCAGHGRFFAGDLAAASAHFAAALEGYDAASHQRLDYSIGDDPLVLVSAFRSWSLWFEGDVEAAVSSVETAVQIGERLAHPPSLAFALVYGAVLHQLRGDAVRAWEWSDRAFELASNEGMPLWMALGRIVKGWALAVSGEGRSGLEAMGEGMRAWEATGAEVGRPHFLCMMAECLAGVGRAEEALELMPGIHEAIERTGQHVFLSEALQVEAMIRWRFADDPESAEQAERLADRASATAASMGLRSPLLRARLLACEIAEADPDAEGGAAREALASALEGFSETATDADLVQARSWTASRAAAAGPI